MTNTNPTIESIIESIQALPTLSVDDYRDIQTTIRESFPSLVDFIR